MATVCPALLLHLTSVEQCVRCGWLKAQDPVPRKIIARTKRTEPRMIWQSVLIKCRKFANSYWAIVLSAQKMQRKHCSCKRQLSSRLFLLLPKKKILIHLKSTKAESALLLGWYSFKARSRTLNCRHTRTSFKTTHKLLTKSKTRGGLISNLAHVPTLTRCLLKTFLEWLLTSKDD